MRILALEFSTDRRSVAVVGIEPGGPAQVLGAAREAGGRSARVFGLIQDALVAAGVEREGIDLVAVGLGPGSFAGIRVALAVAQGWHLARGVRVAGLSSLRCLAFGLQAAGEWGRWWLAVDAQRGMFHVEEWDVARDAVWAAGEPRLVEPAELRRRIETGGAVAGPELVERLGCGREIHPEAGILGRLASEFEGTLQPEGIEPVCLRPTEFVRAAPARTLDAGDTAAR
jgi:tRNA threonylcarbamoyladenosine biosynthesis protein TsaB